MLLNSVYKQLILVQIDGRRGYVNKAHVQEQSVYHRELNYQVPTEYHKVEIEKKNEEEIIHAEEAKIELTEQTEEKQFETKNPETNNEV